MPYYPSHFDIVKDIHGKNTFRFTYVHTAAGSQRLAATDPMTTHS